MSRISPITKGFPFRFELKSISKSLIEISEVLIATGENQYRNIPILYEK